MTIKRLEQSGTIVTSNGEQTLAIDIAALTPIEKLSDRQVDYMLISHIHGDHCSADHVSALTPNMTYTGAECAAALKETGLLYRRRPPDLLLRRYWQR